MNCQEFWERMPELSNQLLTEESEHLARCASCAGVWQRQRTLASGIRRLSEDLRGVEAPERVKNGLVAAFRSQSRRRREMSPRTLWVPLFAGVAAAALLAVGLLLIQDRPPESPRRTSTSKIELAANPVPSAADDEAADSDGFIPLPNAEKIAPDESVNVVRVEVPRSAMLAVGLTVSAEQSSELVEADVKLGADGLARAVRFVNE